VVKKFASILFFLLIGFAGGCIAPFFWGWLSSVTVSSPDAVSIANTYIVFTTIIFVGVTVVLAVMGYVFTHQLSVTRKAHERDLFDEMKTKLSVDERWGIGFATAVIENDDVLRFLEQHLVSKINEKLDDIVNDADRDYQIAADRKRAVDAMASKVRP